MIFLTVGSQLPFDRLVAAMDSVAPRLGQPMFGQIGKSDLRPRNFEYAQVLAPVEFERRCGEACLIVGHAGVGTVLQALAFRKPLVIVPRRAALGEHRNDHQLATARALGETQGIHVAMEEGELFDLLSRKELKAPGPRENSPAFLRLAKALREKFDRA